MNASNFRGVPAGELCDVYAGNGIVVELFRSAGYTGPRDDLQGFRPSAVKKQNEEAWKFATCGANPKNGEFADLYEIGGELVIAIQNKVQIFSVLPVNDFATGKMVMFKGKQTYVGGSSPGTIARFKNTIAHMMKKAPVKTEQEKKAEVTIVNNEKARAAQREEFLAQQRQAEAKRQADMRAREERRREIQGRTRVEAWSAVGQHLFGIPVEGTEWQSLPHGAYAIEMKNGQPVRAFIVEKAGSRASKIRETEATGRKPEIKTVEKTASSMPEAVDQITAELNGTAQATLVFDNMEHLRLLRNSGLNGGTWLGYRKPGTTEVQIYEFHDEGGASEFRSIGIVRP